jgi:CRP/FNR family transcriptional regulator
VHEELIQAFPFFESLPARSRQAVLSQVVRKSLGDGEMLVRDGAECAFLPFIVRGTLRVFKSSEGGKELTLYRIGRGDSCILTTTCILNGGQFPAFAQAEGETEVLLMPARLLARLVEESPEWRRFVFGLYSRRLEDVLALVEEVAFHHVDTRIAAWLLKAQRGSEVAATHAAIADELGTSREVVTRILKDFEVRGLIETSRGRIRIRDAAALGAASGPA